MKKLEVTDFFHEKPSRVTEIILKWLGAYKPSGLSFAYETKEIQHLPFFDGGGVESHRNNA